MVHRRVRVHFHERKCLRRAAVSIRFFTPSSPMTSYFALTFHDTAVFHQAIDFSNDGRFLWTSRFEQFDNTRQTSSDIFCFRCFARNFNKRVTTMYCCFVSNHQGEHRKASDIFGRSCHLYRE